MERSNKLRPSQHTSQELRGHLRTQDRTTPNVSEGQEPATVQTNLPQGGQRGAMGGGHKGLRGPERKIHSHHAERARVDRAKVGTDGDRKSTRLNSSHITIS